jgi:hypothetical protein
VSNSLKIHRTSANKDMLNISNRKVTHYASLLAEILGFFPRTIAPALRITEFSSASNDLKIH